MNRVILLIALVAALLSGLISVGCAGPAPEEKFVWRAEAYAQPGVDEYIFWEDCMEEIREESGGRLDISVFSAGEIVPAEEIDQALGQGVFEVGLAGEAYYMERYPAPAFNYLPFTSQLDSAEELPALYHESGILDVLQEGYEERNLRWLHNAYPCAYPILYSTKPVRTVDDYEGLVVRSFGEFGKVLEHCGAATTYIPGGEVYMALKLGTVDAAHWDNSAMFGMGWWEVTDYYVLPAFNSYMSCCVLANLDAWNSLPEDLKTIFMDAHGRYYSRCADRNEEVDREILDAQEEYEYEVIMMPEEDFAQMRDFALNELWPHFAAQSPRCAEVIELLKDYYK